MMRFILAVPVTSALIVWLLYSVARALKTGVARAGGHKYQKNEHPFWFEFTVFVQVLFAAVFFGVLVKLVRLIIKNWS